MTASKISSSYVTNARANPQVANPLGAEAKAKNRSIVGTMEVATTSIDETGDVIILAKVKGNEIVKSIKLYSDALAASALAVDVGLYKDVDAAGTAATVVDADAYASAITDLQAGSKVGVEVAFEARDIAKMGQTVALDGGESAHSSDRYVALTVTTGGGTPAAGTITWDITVIEP